MIFDYDKLVSCSDWTPLETALLHDLNELRARFAAERERCAKIAEEFDDFAYRGRKIDGYSKGTYMMIDGQKSMAALAVRIRSGE